MKCRKLSLRKYSPHLQTELSFIHLDRILTQNSMFHYVVVAYKVVKWKNTRLSISSALQRS